MKVIFSGTPASDEVKVPATIDTVEKLAAWVLLLLNDVQGSPTNQIAFLDDGSLTRLITQEVATGRNGLTYYRWFVYLPVNPAFVSDNSKKLWEWFTKLTDAIPSTNFNS